MGLFFFFHCWFTPSESVMLPSLYMEEALHLVKFVTWFRLFTNLSHFQEGKRADKKTACMEAGCRMVQSLVFKILFSPLIS